MMWGGFGKGARHKEALTLKTSVVMCGLLLSLCASELWAQDKARLRLCGIDRANPPYYLHAAGDPRSESEPGLLIDLMRQVGQNLNLDLHIQRLPWKRCLLQLEMRRVDAVIGSSYVPEREAYGLYPKTADGQLDLSRALSANTYWIYSQSPDVHWDGKALILPKNGQIGTGLGYSSIQILKNLGVSFVEDYETRNLVERLAADRLAALAGYASELDPILRSSPRYAGIQRLPVPLHQDPIFLMFSRERYIANPAWTDAIWNAIGQARMDGTYEALEARYLEGMPRE